MIISCNECNSSFSVDDHLIKETGSKVRCSKCNSIFVAYPQPLETEEDDDFNLEDLDSAMDDLEEDDESFKVEGLTGELSDELELDLDNFDDSLGAEDGLDAAGLTDDTDGELELDADMNDDDDSDLDMSEDEIAGDELPDLGDFEDLAGLDDDSLALEDTDEGLEDFSLDLEAETDSDETDLEPDGDEELDLADLDLDEEEEAELEAEASTDSEDLDLGLELSLDDDAKADEDISEVQAEIEETDGLDLSDLELEMEDASASDDASDDLNLDLDLEEETPAGAELEEADELDLSDLGLEMEDASVSADTGADVSDDLNLELDLDSEAEAIAGAGDAGADELDLSDLEEIIDSEKTPASGAAGNNAVEDFDMDFDLDTDQGAKTADAGAGADDELDFSDLEQMLETDDKPTADAAGDELDLQFDIDEQPAAEGAGASAAAGASESAQDNDLLDIESMLEQSDNITSDIETMDDDLSLTMEAALDDAASGAEDDLDLDFDIESELQAKEDIFDSRGSIDDPLESNLLNSDDVDFLSDAGLEDESQSASGMTDEFATDDFSSTQGDFGATGVLPEDGEEVTGTPAAKGKTTRSRSKMPVLVACLLLLLAVGVIIIPKGLGIKIPYISDIKIPYLSDLDLKIPYLSDWLNPEAQDVSGNLKIIPMDRTISGKFVNNAKAGRLFVISGKIKNEYDHPRSFITVTGKLYQGGKKLVKKSTVYIGNVIPESDLSGMDITAINNRMKNKFGDKRSNLKIKTGNEIPFMIVFDKLPDNLDEYTVEVTSSSI
jgi:pilus assembly protein FimV